MNHNYYGYIMKNIKINNDLHFELKLRAVNQGVKIFELVEYILTKHKSIKIKKTIGEVK